MSEQNLKVAQRGLEAINETYQSGDLEAWRKHVEEVFDPEVVLESESGAFTEGRWHGHDGATAFVANQMEVLEGMWLRIDEYLEASENCLIVPADLRWTGPAHRDRAGAPPGPCLHSARRQGGAVADLHRPGAGDGSRRTGLVRPPPHDRPGARPRVLVQLVAQQLWIARSRVAAPRSRCPRHDALLLRARLASTGVGQVRGARRQAEDGRARIERGDGARARTSRESASRSKKPSPTRSTRTTSALKRPRAPARAASCFCVASSRRAQAARI